MKHNKKLFALMLCMILAVSMLLPVSASETAEDAEQEIQWEIGADGQTVTYGDTVYTYYAIPSYDWFRPYNFYRYSQYVDTDNVAIDRVGQPMHAADDGELALYADMVILHDYVTTYAKYRVYVTAQGARALDEYMAGNYTQYELVLGSESATLSEQAVRNWNEANATETVDATVLGELTAYTVIGYDSTLTFAHILGEVFEYGDSYLYVNYDALDNSYFDADGNLSFRSGIIPVVRLNADGEAQIADAIDRSETHSANIEEQPEEPMNDTLSMILALVLASPFMYLLPAALLVLGIVMRCIKKVPGRKRWNTVIIASTVWLGISVFASLLLVIPTFFL